ncbi:hypothetical protein BDZ91DRAFT_802594 [Kalaharituber pfeilii]|nr:hypothetical protein BDZ91DRAFT_802594 [Kalaharituber pfeilii]
MRDAPLGIKNVILEIAHLRCVLSRLKYLLEKDADSLNRFPDDVREGLAGNLRSLMDIKLQLSEALQPYMNMTAKTWLSTVILHLKWVFLKEKDIEKLRRHLEAYKSTLGLTFAMMSNLSLIQIRDQMNLRLTFDTHTNGWAQEYGGIHARASLGEIQRHVKRLHDQVTYNKDHDHGHGHRMRNLPSGKDDMNASGVQRLMDSLAEFLKSGRYERTVRTVLLSFW